MIFKRKEKLEGASLHSDDNKTATIKLLKAVVKEMATIMVESHTNAVEQHSRKRIDNLKELLTLLR